MDSTHHKCIPTNFCFFFFEINFFWTKYLKVERFEYKGIFKTLSKIDGALYIVTIFAERSILDVWESSKYASE